MFRLIFAYFSWHYTQALKDFLVHSKNYLWLVFHFFSISVLLKTLFSPWQKLDERYKGGFNIGSLFETFIVNVLMRFVGFFIRFFIICFGLLAMVLTLACIILAFVLWIFLPFIITLLFISGIRLLIQK